MSVIEDLKNTVDTTPFFAAVGATDLAVEKVREARLRADKARADLAVRAEKARVELSTDLAPANVQARATKAVDDAKEIPALAINQTMVFGGKLTEAYDELAARGHKLVKRIQDQKATKDLVAQADTAVAQVKGAVTSARKASADIERSAKATVTTARKEAAKVVTVVERLRRRGDQGRPGRGHQVGQAHPHRGQAHDHHDQERHQEGHHLGQGRDDERSQDRRRRREGHREGRREGRHRAPHPGREAGRSGRELTPPASASADHPVTGFPPFPVTPPTTGAGSTGPGRSASPPARSRRPDAVRPPGCRTPPGRMPCAHAPMRCRPPTPRG